MLRLGLTLLGTAIVLHARRRAATQGDAVEQASDSDDSATGQASQAPPRSWEPTLDPAITTNPLLIGQEGGGSGNPNTAFQFPNTVNNPNTWFSNPELPTGGIPVGTDAWHVGGIATGAQLSTAYKSYQRVTDPSLVKRAYNFHKRLFKKIFG